MHNAALTLSTVLVAQPRIAQSTAPGEQPAHNVTVEPATSLDTAIQTTDRQTLMLYRLFCHQVVSDYGQIT